MTLPSSKKWKVTASKYITNDRWLKLRADTCVTPEGHVLDPYYVLESDDVAVCVVLNEDGEVTLLRHYRYAADEYFLELVGYHIDPGETPEQATKRELEEEVGVVGSQIYKTGVCYTNPANQTSKLYCFLSVGGTTDGKRIDDPGAHFEIIKMPFTEFLKGIEQQDQTYQSLHTTGVFLALNLLKTSTDPKLARLRQLLTPDRQSE